MPKAMSASSIKRIKLGVLLGLLALVVWLLAGCKTYSESFIKLNPDGSTNHIARVTYRTLFIVGDAANLQTATQTEDYIRTVGADAVRTKADSEAITAGGAAIGEILNHAVNPAP
jgi:hypothetical protein